jgi:hypothetical protein
MLPQKQKGTKNYWGISLHPHLNKNMNSDYFKITMDNRKFNFNRVQTAIGESLDKVLNETIEEFVPKLNFALDFLRPHNRALGLRAARLAKDQIEVVLPNKPKNLGPDGEILESAVIAAACEAVRWLWLNWGMAGELNQQFTKIHFERNFPLVGNLHLKTELPELVREQGLMELAQVHRTTAHHLVQVFAPDSRLVAQVEVETKLQQTPAIEWS